MTAYFKYGASLTLRLALKIYAGCKEKADGEIAVKNKTTL